MVAGLNRKQLFILLAVLCCVLFVVVGPWISLSSRVASLEAQVERTTAHSAKLNQRIVFLQMVVGILSRNVTGGVTGDTPSADLREQWVHFKLTGALDEQLNRWSKELGEVREGLTTSLHRLKQLEHLTGLGTNPNPTQTSTTSSTASNSNANILDDLDFISKEDLILLQGGDWAEALGPLPAYSQLSAETSSSGWFFLRTWFLLFMLVVVSGLLAAVVLPHPLSSVVRAILLR